MRGGYCVVAIVVGLVGATVARGASVQVGPVVNPANQHTYYLLTADTWTNSQAFAQTLGGNLVTINDDAENSWVFQQFGSGRDLWIGLNDAQTEGTFAWVSGETSSYRNWRPGTIGLGGQPDDYQAVGGEDYVHIYGSQTPSTLQGYWNDAANDPTVYAGYSFASEVSPIQGVVEVDTTPLPSTAAGGAVLLGGFVTMRRRARVVR